VEKDRIGVFGGQEEGGGVRSGPGEARTIRLLHIISARPSKQPLMVRTFLKVYMELGPILFQEQIKDIIVSPGCQAAGLFVHVFIPKPCFLTVINSGHQ
jgi:hypothetical protein